MGAHQAGGHVKCCVEWDDDSIETLRANPFPYSCSVQKKDISSLDANELLDDADLRI